mgnify:CR=1 FL=1
MRQSARQKRRAFILCPKMGEVKGYVLHAPTDRDATPHLGQLMPLEQFGDDGLQRDPVQRIGW